MVERQLTANPRELNPKNGERCKTTSIVPLNLKRHKNYSTNILLEPRVKRGGSTIRKPDESLRKRFPNTNYTHAPYCWANDSLPTPVLLQEKPRGYSLEKTEGLSRNPRNN